MTLDELVSAISAQVPASVVLVDRGMKLIAYSAQAEDVDEDRVHSILHRSCSREARDWFIRLGKANSLDPFPVPANPDLGAGPRVCVPVVSERSDVCGYLFLMPDRHTDIEHLNVGAARPYADLAAIQITGAELQRGRLGAALHTALAGPEGDAQHACRLLAESGQFASGTSIVMLAVAGSAPMTIPRTAVAPMGHHTAVLASTAGDTETALRELLRQFTLDGNPVGVGSIQKDLSDLRLGWKQAMMAARVASSVPGRGPVERWDGLGLYRLAGCENSSDIREAVLTGPIQHLLDHRNPDLWRSAMTYLDNAGDAAATAAKLGIHRQTLYYRLTKASEVCGMDLTHGEDRLLLHLGLTLGRFMSVENQR